LYGIFRITIATEALISGAEAELIRRWSLHNRELVITSLPSAGSMARSSLP
jgi:hypothetical protein